MSDMKCPFCQQELKYESEVYMCRNPNCKHLLGFGTKELWQELIRTCKALDVAIKYIEHTQKISPFWFNRLANKTLDEIKTALEQKEVK